MNNSEWVNELVLAFQLIIELGGVKSEITFFSINPLIWMKVTDPCSIIHVDYWILIFDNILMLQSPYLSYPSVQ